MTRNFWMGIVAYVLPSFAVAIVWHLMVFAPVYAELEVYRDDMIIPFGLASMLIQGAVFSLIYPKIFTSGGVLANGLKFGAMCFFLGWTYMVLAVGAKHIMASVSGFVMIETGFVALQFLVCGPAIAWAHSK